MNDKMTLDENNSLFSFWYASESHKINEYYLITRQKYHSVNYATRCASLSLSHNQRTESDFSYESHSHFENHNV